ncbi:hypothetical protein GCM10022396_22830 [Flavivirga amylovorans]
MEFKKGTVYVVEMGATWCKPCGEVISKLTKLAKTYQGKVEVIGVFVQEVNREPLDIKSPQYVERVKDYVHKKGDQMNYSVAVDDPQKTIEKVWIDGYGKSRGVPQTFVIDKKGRLVSHFNGLDETRLINTIESLLDDSFSLEKEIKEKEKAAKGILKFNIKKPLYIDNNGGEDEDFMFRSIIGKYPENIRATSPVYYVRSFKALNEVRPKNETEKKEVEDFKLSRQGRIFGLGAPLSNLYYAAYADTLSNSANVRHPFTKEWPDLDSLWWFKKSYGKYWPKPVLEVKDTLPFEFDSKSTKNRWNYELKVPDRKKATAAYLQRLMREDLQRYFGYNAIVETRDMPVWYLKSKPIAKNILKSKKLNAKYNQKDITNKYGGFTREYRNADIRDVIYILCDYLNNGYNIWLKGNIDEPFINKTDIKDGDFIDFDIADNELKYFENMNLEKVQEYLNKIGLYLEKGTQPMKVVVIRDPKE